MISMRHIVFVWLLMCSIPVYAKETAQINADKLRVDHAKKEARFEGHVHAEIGVLDVICNTLNLVYDDEGNIIRLEAAGGVTVAHEGAKAVASHAALNAKAEILVLTGEVVLTRDGHRLQGKRIEIHLRTGRIDVAQARGTFVLKQMRKP